MGRAFKSGALAGAATIAIAFSLGATRSPPARARAVSPASNASSAAFDVAVISDLNQSYGSTEYGRGVHSAVSALRERVHPGLVLITGDMVAGQKSGVNAPAMWRGFHSAVTGPLTEADMLLAPTPGNHDASPSFMNERAEFVKQWPVEQSRLAFIDGSHYPLRYSFTYRGAFFLSLDATAVGRLSNEQIQWVERQLDKSGGYRVKIAFGHLPLYAVAHGREYEILRDSKLESLFEKHAVSAYVSGHHHAYYPGANRGMRHIAMPCLGSGARPLIGTRAASAQAFVIMRVDETSISSISAFTGQRFSTEIARSSLPQQISFGARTLFRDDLLQHSTLTTAGL